MAGYTVKLLLFVLPVLFKVTSSLSNEYSLAEQRAIIDTLGKFPVHLPNQSELLRLLEVNEESFTTQCFKDFFHTVLHYSNTTWGLQMLDSNAKTPVGVLQGSFVFMGQYEECVRVVEGTGRFHGKHCMADINITLALSPTTHMNLPFFYGMCIPSTCSSVDLEVLLKLLVIANNYKGPVAIHVEPENCRLSTMPEPSPGDWVVFAVLFCFVAIGIASTVYDCYQRFKKNNDKPHILWSSFSFYTNGKFLLTTKTSPSMITALFGIRTITMGWVVLGHAYLNTVYSPVIDLADILPMNKDHTKVIIFNSFLSVDTFFLLSGMLACFVFFRSTSRTRSFDQPLGYIHRYLRLTPPYAAVILFEATIFNFIGNGPFWHRIHNQASQNCKDYWYSSLLYVQNYVNPLKLCLTQSWYLSADMQMYWVSPIVLYPMFLWPAIAIPYLGFLTLLVTFVDFTFVYIYDLPANFVLNPSDDRMIYDYYPFHTRMAPWLVGVALGYLISGIAAKKIKLKLSPLMTTCGWILSTVLMTASMQAMDYFNQVDDYTALESAFFLAFHRVGWAIGLSWIILACYDGFGGVVNTILSFPIFQPLAKLSFCAYLLHISVQRFRIGSLLTNVALEDVNVVWAFAGDFVFSNLLAIVFFLLFEQPFAQLDRFLFQGVKIFPWPKPRAPRAKTTEEVKPKEMEEQMPIEDKTQQEAQGETEETVEENVELNPAEKTREVRDP